MHNIERNAFYTRMCAQKKKKSTFHGYGYSDKKITFTYHNINAMKTINGAKTVQVAVKMNIEPAKKNIECLTYLKKFSIGIFIYCCFPLPWLPRLSDTCQSSVLGILKIIDKLGESSKCIYMENTIKYKCENFHGIFHIPSPACDV